MRGLVVGLLLALPVWAVVVALVTGSGAMWCFAIAVCSGTFYIAYLAWTYDADKRDQR